MREVRLFAWVNVEIRSLAADLPQLPRATGMKGLEPGIEVLCRRLTEDPLALQVCCGGACIIDPEHGADLQDVVAVAENGAIVGDLGDLMHAVRDEEQCETLRAQPVAAAFDATKSSMLGLHRKKGCF